MDIHETALPEVLVFEPRVFGDERGYFFESFRQDIFEKHVGKVTFVQDNESFSGYGILRGLHYQKPPLMQGKLVRVVKGRVLDVAVDIRKESPTFGAHVSHILSDENRQMMWIPRGFAHGFVVLSEQAIFSYKCDNYYSPEHEAGILWNDPELAIDWGIAEDKIRVSAKDTGQPFFKDAFHFPYEEFRKERGERRSKE